MVVTNVIIDDQVHYCIRYNGENWITPANKAGNLQGLMNLIWSVYA